MSEIDPVAALKELKWLALAVSQDPTRYAISRIHVDSKRAVATDGHRLHFIENSVLPAGFVVRAENLRSILDLAKWFSLQSIEFEKGGVSKWNFASSDGRVEMVLTPSLHEFPNYERVIPREENARPGISVKFLREKKSPELEGVDFSSVICSSDNSKSSHFNASYMEDALKRAPKTVTLYGAEDTSDAILIKYEADGQKRGAVIMPLRQ